MTSVSRIAMQIVASTLEAISGLDWYIKTFCKIVHNGAATIIWAEIRFKIERVKPTNKVFQTMRLK